MVEKGKISAFQLGIMMYPTVLATGFLMLPNITAQYAQSDLWLCVIVAAVSGIIAIYTATRLHQFFPKETVIQYSRHLIGTIPGKIIGLGFFLTLLHSTGLISRQYAEFVTGNFLFNTPIQITLASMILLCGISVRSGVETLARSSIIFTLLFIFPLFILLLLFRDLDPKNIFPILSHGIVPVLKGAASPQGWIGELFLMTFFMPSLSDPDKGRKWGFISLLAITFSMVYVNLIVLFLLGPDTSNKIYPLLIAFRYISITNFFQNLESLLLAMWVFGNFVKIAVFYYATVISFSQCLNLPNYRPFVFPIGILVMMFSLWDFPTSASLTEFLKDVGPFFLPSVLVLFPVLLLIVAIVRNKLGAKGSL